MTAPKDRTALEEAIRVMEDWWQTGLMPTSELTRFTNADCRRMQLVCDAAAAHVETMPKAKVVEHFRVEGWHPLSGPWVSCYPSKDRAEITAGAFRECGAHHCIKVTGPHLQEVPST